MWTRTASQLNAMSKCPPLVNDDQQQIAVRKLQVTPLPVF